MPRYDYDIQLDGTRVDSILGTGSRARFLNWTAGARRGADTVDPFRHGDIWVPNKPFTSADRMLEVHLPASTDDAAAQALTSLQAYLGRPDRPVLSYTDPDHGDIQALVELVASEPVPTQNRFTYLFPLRNASGFWEDVTLSQAASANPPSVTTGGDRPIDDMVLTFAGVGFLELTDENGKVYRVEIESGAGGTTPYVVDCAAGTAQDSAGTPADIDEYLNAPQEKWMEFSPGAAQSFTSNVSVAVDWRNKYA